MKNEMIVSRDQDGYLNYQIKGGHYCVGNEQTVFEEIEDEIEKGRKVFVKGKSFLPGDRIKLRLLEKGALIK